MKNDQWSPGVATDRPEQSNAQIEDGFQAISFSDIKTEPINWLWPGIVPIGKVTLLVGDPGVGKTFVTTDMAARVSTGGPWPGSDNARSEPGVSILLNAEDDPGDTLKPRLIAAGANLASVITIGHPGGNQRPGNLLNLGSLMPRLEREIRERLDVKLLVIDPITAYLGGINDNRNTEVRDALAPLVSLAAEFHLAVVLVTHFNKSVGGKAVNRAMGSLAYIAVVRASWMLAKDTNNPDRRLMLPAKNNLTQDSKGLVYHIDQTEDGIGVISWTEHSVDMTADQFLANEGKPESRSTRPDVAVVFLREVLESGPLPAVEVFEKGKASGYSEDQLQRAKTRAGVVTNRRSMVEGKPYWEWSVPSDCQGRTEDRGSI